MNELFQKYFPIVAAALFSYFAPIGTAMLFVSWLVMADWITGVIKGHKTKTLSSRKMIKKFYTGSSYLVVLAVVRACDIYFQVDVPLVKSVVAIISLSELQSLRENVEAITGTDPLKNVFSFIQRKGEINP